MKMCSADIKGKKKLGATLSDKCPPFETWKCGGKVLHSNVCWRGLFFVFLEGGGAVEEKWTVAHKCSTKKKATEKDTFHTGECTKNRRHIVFSGLDS